jgi:chromosome segregation ATPase
MNQSQLQAQQSDQLSKRLKLKEQALEQREKLLDVDQRLNKLQEINKQIEVADKQLAIRNEAIDTARATVTDIEAEYRQKFAELDDTLLAQQRTVAKEQTAYNSLVTKREHLDEEIRSAKQKLRDVEADIYKQQAYLKEQETIVNSTIADWNVQLNGFQAEADEIAKAKAQLSKDLVILDQEKNVKIEANEALDRKGDELTDVYLEHVEAYKVELQSYKQRLADQKAEYESRAQADQAKQAEIQTRAQAVTVKEAAVREKERDLSDREQLLKVRLNQL